MVLMTDDVVFKLAVTWLTCSSFTVHSFLRFRQILFHKQQRCFGFHFEIFKLYSAHKLWSLKVELRGACFLYQTIIRLLYGRHFARFTIYCLVPLSHCIPPKVGNTPNSRQTTILVSTFWYNLKLLLTYYTSILLIIATGVLVVPGLTTSFY